MDFGEAIPTKDEMISSSCSSPFTYLSTQRLNHGVVDGVDFSIDQPKTHRIQIHTHQLTENQKALQWKRDVG